MGESSHRLGDFELPADLVAFVDDDYSYALAEGCRPPGRPLFVFPFPGCEVEELWLRRSYHLALERFPVHTGGARFAAQDPHFPGSGSYLVLAVDLVADAHCPYDEAGLLLWLPVERRYAVWSAHDVGSLMILMFGPEVTWEKIAENPDRYVNAGWPADHPDAAPTEELVPWVSHPYTLAHLLRPQPAEPGAAADGGGM